MVSRSTTNWNLFWQHHLGSWLGQWTRYSQSGKIQESFKSKRSFSANSDCSEIAQTNQQMYANGDTNTMRWNYSIDEHSHNDGFAHPASTLMRGFAFENGAAAWLIPQLKNTQYQPFELFLTQKDIRHSVGVLYGDSGQLLHTASIREYRGDPWNNNWSTNTEQVNPWTIEGRWQGEELRIQSDLFRDPIQARQWQWNEDELKDNHANHFFPDNIILRCPKVLLQDKSFGITIYWQTKNNQLQIIQADYNQTHQLIAISQQTMDQTSEQS
ncbi:hypothetical protein Syncc9902_1599 [Synechococcus sp. CC9902]|jgi:hypothetical protein|uniref:DUF3598 family protein n=1 Tax=Synechococcus sp. (strain CC9902) TaxID=316279 RepID=UPI00005D42C1|nr:DUF3598 family protein [Synechococcus sp. CC9902]ABB26557.1 hypothetical protein Syncc9902_1599 [Synechococcus sp. CC9902]